MEKLKTNKSHNNLIYLCLTFFILAILAYGLTTTFDTIFHHLGSAVDKDMFEQSKFYIISFVLIIQFLFLITLGRVKSKARTFCITFFNTVISILMIIGIYAIDMIISSYSKSEPTYSIFMPSYLFGFFPRDLVINMFYPSCRIWGFHDLIRPIIFIILGLLFMLPLQYRFLKKDTKNKKLLLWAICISSFICYSAVSFFFYFKY